MEKKPRIEIDTKKINNVITLSNKILKIFYAVLVCGIIVLVTLISKEWHIIDFLLNLITLLLPLFIGYVIAWLLHPIVTKLQQKGIKRIYGTIIVYLAFIIIVYLFIRMLIPSITNQLNDLVSTIPGVVKSIQGFIDNIFDSFKNIEGVNFAKIQENLYIAVENYSVSLTEDLPTAIISLITSLFSGLGTFFISLVLGFYMLINFNTFSSKFITIIPKKYRYEIGTLISEISFQLKNFVNGTLLTSLIICIASYIGFAIIGIEAPLLFGIFCGITNIIPYVGPYVGAAPAVVVAFSMDPTAGVITLIYILIVQGIEGNIINPLIMSRTMKLHPITIIVSLIVFGSLFGIVGMILATPIVAFIKILFQFFANKFGWTDYMYDTDALASKKTIISKSKKQKA